MNVDLAGLWSSQAKDFFTLLDVEAFEKLWALDFKQEVLPELGPECGGVVLELPDLMTVSGGSLAFFCKLKSNKLGEALKTGKLFRGVGPVTDFTELKVTDVSFFFTVRNGFLVVANSAKGLAAFDGKSSLAATRDYSRAAAKVPGGIIAFGGYNLEAAVAAASKATHEGPRAEAANLLFSIASAFHSQNFYATATAGTIEGRSSVAMDREGRYPVADLSYLPRGTNITFVTVEPGGIPITDQNRLSSLVLRVRAKSPGPIDNIKDDIKSTDQIVEQNAATELRLTIPARRGSVDKEIELPIKDPALEPYLKATVEFPADNKEVVDQAREIAGKDRDAWSVARKLADWTHKNLVWKQVVSASASQTLATREADCSEFSQLFVSMARSLGLPARMVSGLAYSGNSFGGHAWVEVWVGKWIELDPTWGTAFVDATHIRNTSNALVMSAALNLIELEVLETKRTVADFQKTSRGLAEHLLNAIPNGDRSEVEAAIDLATLTDEYMGAGTWSTMTPGERDQMSSAYRRLLNEIIQGYGDANSLGQKMRLLHLDEKGDQAEAVYLLSPDELLKARLVRRNELWHLVELLQADFALHTASEMLQPTIETLKKTRSGQKAPRAGLSDFVRIMFLIESNPAKSIEVADAALKVQPKDKGLRFLKALALLTMEDREEEGVTLLRELSNEAFSPAVYKLADSLRVSEDENENKQAVELYERYTSLEPHDPRGFRDLAIAYDNVEECEKAEPAYRKAIALDPGNTDGYLNLIVYLALHDRVAEVRPVLEAGEKHKTEDEDVFGSALQNLYFDDKVDHAEKLAASEPVRMKTSYLANITMARIHSSNGRIATALQLFNIAAQLDKKSPYPHIGMAQAYRKQSRWALALKAADKAIVLDATESEGYYQRACALTRLGRIKEALAALTKSVELDPEQTEYMVEEADLKALAKMPAFKKLIPQDQ
jgi:transglutaminase-like putative cysteine protease/Flp pilus assembly protein TadD